MSGKRKTPPLLRTSERSDFKRCPWRWEQVWLNGLRGTHEPTWAWFGTAWHKSMEAYYPKGKRRGKINAMKDAFRESADGEHRRVYTEGDAEEMDAIEDAYVLADAMIDGYVAKYGKDEEWEVIHTEQPFQIDVPHPTKPGKTLVVYAGTWDLLARNRSTGELWLWDHKTRKAFVREWSYLGLNDQAGSYLWVAHEVLVHKGIITEDQEIEGIVFNYARKHMPDTRPLNSQGMATNKPIKEDFHHVLHQAGIVFNQKATISGLEDLAREHNLSVCGAVSKVQPMPLFARVETYRSPQSRLYMTKRVQDEAIVMDAMRRGKLPIYKTPTEDCPRCPVFDICELHEQGDDWQSVRDQTFIKRDVYADHREAMERKGLVIHG